MKWSFKIGSLFEIPVYVHVTFLLLLAWVGLSGWSSAGSLGHGLYGIVFVLAIFGCVVLHEFGHALAARRFGIRTRDVTLLPIGGVARLERMPERPRQELWVALAGPAVNVGIAALLALWLALRATVAPPQALTSLLSGSFTAQLLGVNLVLVVFNLLPAFPMDGGRVLRALLAERMPYDRATDIAAKVGKAFALLFAVAGLAINPMLLLIALFVWFGAGREADMARVKSTLDDAPIGKAMLTDFRTVRSADRLQHAADLTLAGSQRDFPVVDDGVMVGILRQPDLLAGLSRFGPESTVDQAMLREVELVELSEMVEAVFARLQSESTSTLPVTRQGRLVGLATLENIREYLAIRKATALTAAAMSGSRGRD